MKDFVNGVVCAAMRKIGEQYIADGVKPHEIAGETMEGEFRRELAQFKDNPLYDELCYLAAFHHLYTLDHLEPDARWFAPKKPQDDL